MQINATLVNLYHICKRECWLHANGINMEQTSDIVYDGKHLHETSYSHRAGKHSELELTYVLSNGNFIENPVYLTGKIDYYDADKRVVHEIKRSNKVESAHEWQVKFYLWLLELNGIKNSTAILEYPLLRQTDIVILETKEITYLENLLLEIVQLKESKICPPVIHSKICKSCSYHDLCYAGE